MSKIFADTIAYGVLILATIMSMVYLFTYYPAYFLNQSFKFTDNYMENYVIFGSFLPLFLVALLGPFVKNQKSFSVVNRIWRPVFNCTLVGWEMNSVGDIVMIVFVIISNLIWWFTPLLTKATGRSFTPNQIMDQLAATAGIVGMNDACCAIFFAIRENVIAKLWMGNHSQYHHNTRYHVMFGYFSLFFLTIHSIYYPIIYLQDGTFEENLYPWVSMGGVVNFAGFVAWFALILMAITGIRRVRSANYKLFYWTHQLYVIFFLASFIHFYICWYPVLGMLVYMVYDRMVGYSKFPRNATAVITKVSDCIVRVDIPVSMYGPAFPSKPGDWIKITFPKISNWDAHPFSIANAHNVLDTVTIYIKVKGHWTNRLLFMTDLTRVTPVAIQGPFGVGQNDFQDFKEILFIAAGTGMAAIIPFIGKFASKDKKTTVIWSVKNKQDILAFTDFLDLFKSKEVANSIKVKIHVTESLDLWVSYVSEEEITIPITDLVTTVDPGLFNSHYSQSLIAFIVFTTGNSFLM
jgi:NAD(P)H-flavin reductase